MATASTCGGSSTKPIKPNNRYCCVSMCNSDGRYDNDISFHHIPKDETIKKRWIIKIKRDEGPLFQVSSIQFYNKIVCMFLMNIKLVYKNV